MNRKWDRLNPFPKRLSHPYGPFWTWSFLDFRGDKSLCTIQTPRGKKCWSTQNINWLWYPSLGPNEAGFLNCEVFFSQSCFLFWEFTKIVLKNPQSFMHNLEFPTFLKVIRPYMELSTKPFLRYCRTRILTCHYILFFFSSSNPGNFSNSQVFFQKKSRKNCWHSFSDLNPFVWKTCLCWVSKRWISLYPQTFLNFERNSLNCVVLVGIPFPCQMECFLKGPKRSRTWNEWSRNWHRFQTAGSDSRKPFFLKNKTQNSCWRKSFPGISLTFLLFFEEISCMNPHQLHWYFSLQSRKLPKSFRVEFEVSVNKLLKFLGGKEIPQETVVILEPKLDKGKCLKVCFGKQVGFDRFQKKYIFLSFLKVSTSKIFFVCPNSVDRVWDVFQDIPRVLSHVYWFVSIDIDPKIRVLLWPQPPVWLVI